MKAELKTVKGYQGDHMILPVENLDTAIPFYETVLGFRVLSRGDAPQRSAVLGRDDIQIGLAENGGDPTQDGCAFQVSSSETLFAEFKSNGLDQGQPTFDIEAHGGTSFKVFYVVAPDGLCYWFGELQEPTPSMPRP
jgi:catechol 2,3-dioxygenase-like lactoylglutathione lyase family enzyme